MALEVGHEKNPMEQSSKQDLASLLQTMVVSKLDIVTTQITNIDKRVSTLENQVKPSDNNHEDEVIEDYSKTKE